MRISRPIAFAALLLLAAFWLRLPGVSWGLPYVLHPDEPTNYRIAWRMAGARTLDPKFFQYPSLFLNLQALAQLSWIETTGILSSEDTSQRFALPDMEAMATGRLNDTLSFRLGRSVTLAFALGTVALIMAMTWQLTGALVPTVFAGAVFTVSGVAIANAVLITPDTYAGCLTVLALWSALRLLRDDSLFAYVLAGLATGLAAGAKYNAILVSIPVAAAHLLRLGREGLNSSRAWAWVLVAMACAVAAFVFTTPMALFDPAAVWAGMSYEREHYARGQVGFEGDSLAFYASALLRSEGLALVGLMFAWMHPRLRAASLVLTLFVVAYVSVIGSYTVHFARNLVPVLPAIAVLAGIGGDAVLGRLHSWNVGRKALAAIAGMLLCLAPQTRAALAWRAAQHVDERASARTWVRDHIRPGTVIMVDAFGPWLPPTEYQVRGSDRLRVARATTPAINASQVVLLTSAGSGLYLDAPDRYPAEVKQIEALRARSCYRRTVAEGDDWVEILFLNCSALVAG